MIRSCKFQLCDRPHDAMKLARSLLKKDQKEVAFRHATQDSTKALPKQSMTLLSSEDVPPLPAVAGSTVAAKPLIPVHTAALQPKDPEMTLKASPYAKQVAAMRSIDLRTVQGSGPEGMILVSDLPSPKPEKTCFIRPAHWKSLDHFDIPISDYRIALSKMRSEAKAYIPHYSLEAEINVDKLLKLRGDLISKLKAQRVDSSKKIPKLTINDFIIKASAMACMKVHEVNSAFMEDYIRKHDYVNISFAVDTKSSDLILSPVIFDAHIKDLYEISTEVTSLIDSIRAGKVHQDMFHGGTFSISNLGMVGSLKNFASIVYPPNTAVIAIGGIRKSLVPIEDSTKYSTVSTMQVTLSCDHRVVDGAIGSNWLREFKSLVENPMKLLL